jgi:transposase
LRRVQRKLVSTDPQRLAILSRIRWVWQHLPKDGVLLFFDVKPVFVKAYGGCRYTSAPRLVLPKPQRTRGHFYLFGAYDVATGRRRWAFMEGKSTPYVCRFMRVVRRWYPTQQVWVVLDQERAHPCKSRETKHVMRQLRLRWISLPKCSPDDNPVEAIFSDIQLMILDHSNDPDVATTQCRISRHLRANNQRKSRWIKIPYLPNSEPA